MKNFSFSGLVYSTDTGRTCPVCRQAIALCSCKADQAAKAMLALSKGRYHAKFIPKPV